MVVRRGLERAALRTEVTLRRRVEEETGLASQMGPSAEVQAIGPDHGGTVASSGFSVPGFSERPERARSWSPGHSPGEQSSRKALPSPSIAIPETLLELPSPLRARARRFTGAPTTGRPGSSSWPRAGRCSSTRWVPGFRPSCFVPSSRSRSAVGAVSATRATCASPRPIRTCRSTSPRALAVRPLLSPGAVHHLATALARPSRRHSVPRAALPSRRRPSSYDTVHEIPPDISCSSAAAWPGNVREVPERDSPGQYQVPRTSHREVVQHLLGRLEFPREPPPPFSANQLFGKSQPTAARDAEYQAICAALRPGGGQQEPGSTALQTDYKTLYTKIGPARHPGARLHALAIRSDRRSQAARCTCSNFRSSREQVALEQVAAEARRHVALGAVSTPSAMTSTPHAPGSSWSRTIACRRGSASMPRTRDMSTWPPRCRKLASPA